MVMQRRFQSWIIRAVIVGALWLTSASAWSGSLGIHLPNDPNVRRLEQLVNPKDGRIDYAQVQVAIDHMVDPSVNEAATLTDLDHWAAIVRARVPAGATPLQVMNVLGGTLALPGAWNDNRPFSYDLSDPLGSKFENKLVSTYLRTRKGNCVSMPTLLVILGQKLGLDMTLSLAPAHEFAKIRNSDGRWFNIEATSSESPTDAEYIAYLHIPSQAIQSGIYLRTLTPRETVGAMLDPLEANYAHVLPPEYLLNLTKFLVKLDPKNVSAQIFEANAYFLLLRQRYLIHQLTPEVLPPAQRADFLALYNTNVQLFHQAEQMGWQAPTKEGEQEYLERVRKWKQQHNG
jgi:regulator of sirC expression with transglutaminase-like and TPR domain